VAMILGAKPLMNVPFLTSLKCPLFSYLAFAYEFFCLELWPKKALRRDLFRAHNA
jgi:hypothetical protein